MNKKCIIITTINNETEALIKYSEMIDYDLIIVGDLKSPKKYNINCIFLDIEKQTLYYNKISKIIPYNHYCRKNIGYIYAIEKGYDIIYETDDDNIPYNNWTNDKYSNKMVKISDDFINIYKLYTKENIWPRGLPLDKINNNNVNITELPKNIENIFIWQGLCDNDPDVDSIFRLINKDKTIYFLNNHNYILDRNVFTPFNSQNTIWKNTIIFPFLYLPCTVSFRFTDILRSYICNFAVWNNNGYIGINNSNVKQIRNTHNLMHDFNDEMEMFTNFYKIYDILKNINIRDKEDLYDVYYKLYKENIVQKLELKILKEWMKIF